jgi:glucose-1-phosphatase
MINIKIETLSEKPIDTIIFDLGGVLLNLDFKRSIDAFINLGFINVEKEISSGEFRDELRKHAGLDISDEDIDRAWTAMLMDLHEENLEIMEKLKCSYRIFLLSNTNPIHIESLHSRNDNSKSYSGLVGLCEKAYYSYEVKMRKPDREIFDHVISDADLDPGKTLFIDDSIPNIETAEDTGLQAYHHKANASLREVFNITGQSQTIP